MEDVAQFTLVPHNKKNMFRKKVNYDLLNNCQQNLQN